jgi:hypothetical protein
MMQKKKKKKEKEDQREWPPWGGPSIGRPTWRSQVLFTVTWSLFRAKVVCRFLKMIPMRLCWLSSTCRRQFGAMAAVMAMSETVFWSPAQIKYLPSERVLPLWLSLLEPENSSEMRQELREISKGDHEREHGD